MEKNQLWVTCHYFIVLEILFPAAVKKQLLALPANTKYYMYTQINMAPKYSNQQKNQDIEAGAVI